MGDPNVECTENQFNKNIEYVLTCSAYRNLFKVEPAVDKSKPGKPSRKHVEITEKTNPQGCAKSPCFICQYQQEKATQTLKYLKVTAVIEQVRKEIDKVIEDDITQRLAQDLLQSIERKYQADLEKSVDMVLSKIKLLLQNGTTHIQDRLVALQSELTEIKNSGQPAVDTCLAEYQNDTVALAEKALHQMVLCGYALIGHDPAHALTKVIDMKQKIKEGLRPIDDHKQEVLELLKLCGHDHDSLKKVIKCVISKSPTIKTAMMDVTGKLIDGVVQLTKLMAHGAMHEACLIEVVKTIEEEAITIINNIRTCVYGNDTATINEEANKYLEADNATMIDVPDQPNKPGKDVNNPEMAAMKDLIRRMLNNDASNIDKRFKRKLQKLEKHLKSTSLNQV